MGKDRPLKSQAAHDRERRSAWRASPQRSEPTGVACEKCGQELLYADDLMRLSMPPQRLVYCSGCCAPAYILA